MRKCDFIAVFVAVAAFTGPVFGHAKLLSTVPAANAQVAAAPSTLKLRFDEPVKLAKFDLKRAGVLVPLVFDPDATPAAELDIALPTLKPGNYSVTWSALTVDDGHVVRGSFLFVIQGAAS